MPDTTIPAQNVLVDLTLDKVSLCNQGANSRAHILLTKRRENENMPKTFEELLAKLEPEHAEIVKEHVAAIEKANEEKMKDLNATIDTLNKSIEEAKVEKNKKEDTTEEVLKKASPELAAYIENLQKSVNTLVADKEEVIAKERFAVVKALPVEEETLKTVLKSASPAVYEVLKKAAQAVEEAVLKTTGKDLPSDTFTEDSAYAKLEKSARAIMAEDVTKSFEQAFTDACASDPDTYAKYYTKGAK